jgi:hypothetical protein
MAIMMAVSLVNKNKIEYMKRTCHGNHIQGGGKKGHINLVENAIFLWHGVPHVRI